jgi:hypothetical protein
MKNTICFILISFFFLSCGQDKKNNDKEEQKEIKSRLEKTESTKLVRGEFITVDTAAVIKSRSKIYGVILDSMGQELNKRSKALQNEAFDMIPVSIRGEIIQNDKEDEWEEIIRVKEIIDVRGPEKKIEDKKIKISTSN